MVSKGELLHLNAEMLYAVKLVQHTAMKQHTSENDLLSQDIVVFPPIHASYVPLLNV